ncbi:hypothetical protein M1M25_gp051 [Tenacibaculum phage Gundel_1]|uniref:Uncharacterized protein n=1 Tax=Tenacibaculum phage Gundel_1 TaxID=2745672 RepID=A0A8E4ZFZ6_9CAUD|nr:hypothetical protein M1M25_gp051 [Tenacibaculum phage Gundel_1]QQV91485.1 hypothetical protein Gundel1_51 [Tenacibaculum phage Gundel_1]
MRGLKILLVIMCISWGANAQQTTYDFSVSSSTNFSKGAELRGNFKTWYIAFQLEHFLKDKDFLLNWGAAIGIMKNYNDFTFTGGVRFGFIIKNGYTKPSKGLETEIDYNVTDTMFFGVRGAYDVYHDSPDINTPTSKDMIRAFVKVGFKF